MGKKSVRAKTQPPGPTSSERQQVQLKIDELPIVDDPTLKLLWIDRVTLAVRGDVPVGTIRCYSVLGTESHVACQFQTSVQHLIAMTDMLCRVLNHYPVRADAPAK